MSLTDVRIARGLGWGGVIPFGLMPLAVHLGPPDWLETLLLAYGLLILAFMAGTLWARHVLFEPVHGGFLVASNLLALAGWPVILMNLSWGSLWLALLFTLHLVLDQPWRSHGLPGWYRRLRLGLSASVITLLVMTGLIGRLNGG